MPKLTYLTLLSSLFFLFSCSLNNKPLTPSKGFTVLAINDVYRLDNLAKVRTLRKKLEKNGDVLMLHAGDFLFPSLLSREFKGEQMIDVMNLLDGDAKANDPRLLVTFGNHEFDKGKMKYKKMLQDRITESQFAWVSSNVEFRSDSGIGSKQLTPHKIITLNGINIGVFGLTLDVKIPKYVSRITDPITTARRMTKQLRQQGADVVIALTHLTMEQDKQLLNTLNEQGPDIIFGGHEHNKQSINVQGHYAIKADADALTATVAHITPQAGKRVKVDFHFQDLTKIQPDAAIKARISYWKNKHAQQFCSKKKLTNSCLSQTLGKTRVTLKAEELEIRRYETNLGSWVTDLSVQAYADKGAQIALINAGGLRLNHNIPANSNITRKTLNEIFAYPTNLALIKIKGATLQKIINRSIQGWTGSGHWLQISGFAFRHNPATNTADQLTLLDKDGARLVKPDEDIIAVINYYLLDPKGDQDGYKVLSKNLIINPDDSWPDLRNLVEQALQKAGSKGIAPSVEGRVCNTQRKGKCLAVGG